MFLDLEPDNEDQLEMLTTERERSNINDLFRGRQLRDQLVRRLH